VPSRPAAFKSGTPFAAVRIVSGWVLYDTLGNSKQRRLIAKVPPSRVQLRLELAPMLFALFQRYETSDEKADHGANTDKNYNGDYADRPFKYGSCFHSLATDEHRSNTDCKSLYSVAAPLWEGRLK
jgi:hypothetical protein